ncbi:hypothetical protein Tco_0037559 [Tanacetum coccineum]
MLKVLRMKHFKLSRHGMEHGLELRQKKEKRTNTIYGMCSIIPKPRRSAFNVSKDTLNRFKVRGFGSLLEAGTKADTKHDIGPTCR